MSAKKMDPALTARHELVLECTTLHQKLHRVGLYKTGQAMHKVVQAIGWELAEHIKKAKP